jgi:hypothetical protein
MSYFVLVYDRARQNLLELRGFDDTDYEAAEAHRMRAQLEALRSRLDHEIVLFQSPDEATLRQTHGSYFLSARELLERAREAVEAG